MEYTLKFSDRNSIAIEISPEKGVVVRAPFGTTQDKIEEFLSAKKTWIISHLAKAEKQKELAQAKPLSSDEIKELRKKGNAVFAQRAAYYAPIVGVKYNSITVKSQRTKWGSCSAKGNLNFNCLLLLAPIEVLDSVVVHELCHLKYLNHSKDFYHLVYRVFPDYELSKKWLKDNGGTLMARMNEV